MKIAIDLTSLSYHLSGIERYAKCIAIEMIKIDNYNEYVLIFRNNIDKDFECLIDEKRVKSVVCYGEQKLLFIQFVLMRVLYSIKADKYLFLAFPSPILFKRGDVYNTIHDMGVWDVPQGMKLLSRLYYKISFRNAIRVSKRIITISNFSKRRIKEIFNYNPDNIIVAYCGLSDKLINGEIKSFDSVCDKYNLPNNYIMSLSTIEPRKNLRLLVEAYCEISNQVNYELVLVGRKGWLVDDLINKYSVVDKIHFTGFVDDDDISAIYKNALCFVFPTLYEGFGIPPVEALSIGTRVISSDAEPMKEILQDNSIFFKSNDKEDLKNKLLNIIDDKKNVNLNVWQRDNFDYKKSARIVICMLEDIL